MTCPGATDAPGSHQDAGEVPVHRLVVVGVIEQDEEAVLGIFAQLVHGPAAGRADDAPTGTAISSARMGLVARSPALDLAAGDESGLVQRPAAGERQADGRAAGGVGHTGEDHRGDGRDAPMVSGSRTMSPPII